MTSTDTAHDRAADQATEWSLLEAAREALSRRLRRVGALLPLAGHRSAQSVDRVHQLRVAARRAEAAIEAFALCMKGEAGRKAARRLRRIRRAAGAARDCDVQQQAFAALKGEAPVSLAPAIDWMVQRLEAERDEAQRAIVDAMNDNPREQFRQRRRNVVQSLREPLSDQRATLTDGARAVLPRLIAETYAAGAEDLGEIARLHAFRIRVKRMRYGLELFGPCLPPELEEALTGAMRNLQDHLGLVHDGDALVGRLQRCVYEGGWDGQPLLAFCSGRSDRLHAEFLTWWKGSEERALFGLLDRALRAIGAASWSDGSRPATVIEGVRSSGQPMRPAGMLVANGSTRRMTNEPQQPQPARPTTTRRIAAIDVGTNSIRLIVAEAFPDGSYRVLDDEKETVRLGQGLASDGRMRPDAIDRTVQAVARMKSIAEGYGAGVIRVVGTAAVREAANRDDFIDALRARTGLEVRVISADEEAHLAFLSASHAFDLGSIDAAVTDIGGGSMEVVLSSSGVVERVYMLPLGAVRLTERFGGPDEAAGRRYAEMREWIKRELKREIGRPPFTPQVLIGMGGTLTTLANISLQRDRSPESDSAVSPSALRGHEMKRSELKHLITWLRDVPLKDRAKIPGLPPDRADIIIAGLTAAERLMKQLGVNRLRAHDRGIRDGILLELVAEMQQGPGCNGVAGGTGPAPADRLTSVRKFADTCDFDRRHCDHVAALAVRIFDQLAEQVGQTAPERWSRETRLLLEAAALIHDVGYHINYTKHHLHSYHLIVHADLRGFTPREIEIVANVARYHRRAVPKKKHPNYARLSREDRDLVKRLAGVLRVADGLDRTHTQCVRDAALVVENGEARLILDAAADPGVDIWGAEQKQSLFESVFGLRPRFEWAAAPDAGELSESIATGADADAAGAGADDATDADEPRPVPTGAP